MQYDLVKKTLGTLFSKGPASRKLFFRILNILLLRSWYVRRELKRWSRTMPGLCHILDAGTGFGQYSYFLSRLSGAYHIKAVDISGDHINDCRRFFKSIGRTHQVDCRTADLVHFADPQAYDLILCVDVMEHIAEDEQVLRNFFLSLREKGTLILTTPSDKGGSDAHDKDDRSFISEHVRNGYSIAEMQSKLQKAGFREMRCMYTYGRAGNLAWKLTVKYPVLALHISKSFLLLLPLYYLLTYPICLLLNILDITFQQNSGTGLMVKAWK